LYLDCARQPLFQQYNYAETDNKLSEAAYWAVFCGYKLQNPKATLHHVYQALKDTTHYCLMLQYLAETYKLENDTTRWVETLQEGFSRYPLFPFFFPRLISYYGEKGDWNKVETISNEALKADSTKQTFLFAKSTALLNLSRLNECVEVSERIIKADSLFPDAYYNAGLAYYNRAEQLNKKLQQSAKTKNEIKANYKKAMPYLQRYRALKPDDSSQWLMPLYNIYLNLNMGKEFDEVDRLMRTKK
jgi:tetratricopeptide (TPR) repeat protein